MQLLHWRTYGKGNINIILIHGWGISSKIWLSLVKKLKKDFCVHLLDLPGYGYSKEIDLDTLDKLVNVIVNDINVTNTILVGWSLGGLIATKMVLLYPKNFIGLVLISFSPYFCADYNWPGIDTITLINFFKELNNNYIKIMSRFIYLQNINIRTTRKEIVNLKNIFLSKNKIPSIRTLKFGLKLLKNTDLRKLIDDINIPHINVYGKLDSIVSYKIASFNKNKKNINFILKNSAHMPFISESNNFYNILYNFIKGLDRN
ncbi:MAG: alpha/beta fold hydrolase [Candidatus Lightella neohaematopini]|nr:alpha/beta fold hydrolase [Candidatus Lightella neohaematopini]MCV2531290.1 alpha/beta fold hydrolase [Candidatus Lightella neohaematopini]